MVLIQVFLLIKVRVFHQLQVKRISHFSLNHLELDHLLMLGKAAFTQVLNSKAISQFPA